MDIWAAAMEESEYSFRRELGLCKVLILVLWEVLREESVAISNRSRLRSARCAEWIGGKGCMGAIQRSGNEFTTCFETI